MRNIYGNSYDLQQFNFTIIIIYQQLNLFYVLQHVCMWYTHTHPRTFKYKQKQSHELDKNLNETETKTVEN